MALYRAPFPPYCERQEANDPDPKLRVPWDGCWAWTLARALDAATGGKLRGQNEDTIRAACGHPDRPGSDPGFLSYEVAAVQKLAPGLSFGIRPTIAELRAHLAAGGIAVLSGWANNAPVHDRACDPAFYDRIGKNGHSIYVHGLGDGKLVNWGNPERFPTWAEPNDPIEAAVRFVWPAQNGVAGRVEALLFKAVPIVAPPVQTYRVVKGDTLIGIARRFGIKPWTKLWIKNLAKVPIPTRMRIGTVLVLP